MKIYGADICPDCVAFKALMAERSISAEFVDITESVANLRAFLKLRDENAVFNPVRTAGAIGIPAFVDGDRVTLDENEALEWMGQLPMDKRDAGCPECR